MSRIWALGFNTFREAVRDRILVSILLFAVGIILCSAVMHEITIGDQDKVVRSVAQGAIDVFAAIIAIFLGISLVWKELDKKTIYTIISKPIPRWMFVLGKYIGLMFTISLEVFLLTAVYTVFVSIEQHPPPPIFFVSVATLMLELLLITSWATLFSASSAPTTAAAFTMAIYVIGHLADDLWRFGNQSESMMFREFAHAMYWILPNFEIFNLREAAVHETAIPWERVRTSVMYGLSYSTAVLGVAMSVFSRRDIQ